MPKRFIDMSFKQRLTLISTAVGGTGLGLLIPFISRASASGTIDSSDTMPIVDAGLDAGKAMLIAGWTKIMPYAIVVGILFGIIGIAFAIFRVRHRR
jgi:hypothetical protein